jgi:hypothetical protein
VAEQAPPVDAKAASRHQVELLLKAVMVTCAWAFKLARNHTCKSALPFCSLGLAQEGEEVPCDWMSLFDTKLFGFDTNDLLPDALALYSKLNVKKAPLSLIQPQASRNHAALHAWPEQSGLKFTEGCHRSHCCELLYLSRRDI